jgi:type 1 glutamine amidotransferase
MSNPIRIAIALPVLLLLALSAGSQEAKRAAKIRALIITGDDVPAHDWKETTPVTREILEATGKFEARVCEEIGILDAGAALAGYDLLVLNFRNRPEFKISETARKNLADFVASGKGLVSIHFSANAFQDWPDYRNLIGKVWVGRTSGHGPRGPFKAEIAARDHPVTRGLENFEIDDELYARLVGTAPVKVLVQAHSDWSGQVEPLVWTLDYQKGRVFHTSLGHDARARRHPAFGTLLLRGAEWAATGRITETPGKAN